MTFGYLIGEDTLHEGIQRMVLGIALVVEGELTQLPAIHTINA